MTCPAKPRESRHSGLGSLPWGQGTLRSGLPQVRRIERPPVLSEPRVKTAERSPNSPDAFRGTHRLGSPNHPFLTSVQGSKRPHSRDPPLPQSRLSLRRGHQQLQRTPYFCLLPTELHSQTHGEFRIGCCSQSIDSFFRAMKRGLAEGQIKR